MSETVQDDRASFERSLAEIKEACFWGNEEQMNALAELLQAAQVETAYMVTGGGSQRLLDRFRLENAVKDCEAMGLIPKQEGKE